MERFFGELSQCQLTRLAVNNVKELESTIESSVAKRNQDPKPFDWTASVEEVS